jgi:hypothetical protein
MAIASVALLGWLSVGLNFGGDEWTMMSQRMGWSAADLFSPHNEHWSTLLVLFYKAMLATFGFHSYLPYAVAVACAYAVVAVLVFVRIRQTWGTTPALACAAILFFYGNAAEDLLWDFQLGFAGALVCGLGALAIVEGARPRVLATAAASLLLVLSLMWSGLGLIFLLVAAVEFSLDRRLRWALPSVAVGALVFAVWYATFGHQGVHGLTFTVSTLPAVAAFALVGLMISTASLVGLPLIAGEVLGLQMVAVLAYRLARRWRKLGQVPPQSAAAVVGVLAFFASIGLERAGQFGIGEAASSRYLLPAAVFLMPLAVEALQDVPRPRVVFGWLAAVSLALNLFALVSFVQTRQDYLLPIKAEIAAVISFRNAPGLDPNTHIDDQLLGTLTPGEVWRLTAAYGSPYPAYTPDQLGTLPATPVNSALVDVFAAGLEVTPGGGGESAPCQSVSAGRDLRFRVPMGGSLTVAGGAAEVRMWWVGAEPLRPVKVLPGDAAPVSLKLPGPPGVYWWVGIRAVGTSDLVCAVGLA